MYIRHFGLKEPPFSISPDPRYLYLSRRHQEALAHLIYGVTEGGGFVQLTGDVGTGKTMLIRALLERLPDNVDVALILYPILSVEEFISAICDELRIKYAKQKATLKSLIDALNTLLLENHSKARRTVLIIDEAQNLSRDVLEQLRLLTNLETSKEKLMQILLVGQPELNNMLTQADLRQLGQRITARYSLMSLYPHETSDYIVHRCRVAGAKNQLFSPSAMRCVHRYSGGVPRVVNMICDRALLGAYARSMSSVSASIVRHATGQIGIVVPRAALWRPGFVTAAAVAAALLIGWQLMPILRPWYASSATVSAQQVSAPGDKANVQTAAQAKLAKLPNEPVQTGETAVVQASAAPVAEQQPRQRQPLTLSQLLAAPEIATDTDTALAGLFSHWGLDYAKLPGRTGCARAVTTGLQCILQSGTWNNLRHLNRPAVIELIDEKGRKHHVLVSGLKGDQVSSEIGGHHYSFPISEFDRYWYGEYLLLWKPPLVEGRVLRRGMRGPWVVWLRDTLARYEGKPAPSAASDMFDEQLEAQVKAFQRSHRLTDDGIVGRLTMLQLNTYDPTAAPPLLWKLSRAETG
jgi:general secretion pathway protein A